jgi:ribosomal protein S18 acetylase RimI-like enzyme
MTSNPFANIVWHALHTEHAQFAIEQNGAARYQAEIAPFAAFQDQKRSDVAALRVLFSQGERFYLIGGSPASNNATEIGSPLQCLQMVFPERLQPASRDSESQILRLSSEDALDMITLTDLAFPGFFRPRTYEMGTYYGIRAGGQLVAMAGERLSIPGYREISAVCTHPEHTGRGYAKLLMFRLIRDHAEAGLRSFLHVSERNTHAIGIYSRMGFTVANAVPVWPVCFL